MGTFFEWLRAHAELAERYAHAREVQGELLADELRELADSADSDNYNAVRLKLDTRKWCAAKLAPKRYGEKLELAGAKDAPLKVQVEMIGGEE